MKKPFLLVLPFILFSLSSYSQEDFGYKTKDLGIESQLTPDGVTLNLHFALNARLHHSFILQGGYNKVSANLFSNYQEKGSGWGGTIGYRYFTGVIPKRFYIGARAALWKMDIDWSTLATKGTTKLTIFHPSVETGYVFLINEVFFITPHIMAGQQIKLSSDGADVKYGEDFIASGGISLGFRF